MSERVSLKAVKKAEADQKAARAKMVEVSLPVEAVDFGYIKGRMYQPGEKFIFNGKVDPEKGLAFWMVEREEGTLDKILAKVKIPAQGKPSSAAAPAAKKATVKAPATAPAATEPAATLDV